MTSLLYEGSSTAIPLCDVQHVEQRNPLGLIVVTCHTRWDFDKDEWANNAWIDRAEAPQFMAAWREYLDAREAPPVVNAVG